jgi:peptidoglycan-associated lipoprotein
MKTRIATVGLVLLICIAFSLLGGCAKKTKVAIDPASVVKEQPAAPDAAASGAGKGGTEEGQGASSIREERLGDGEQKETGALRESAQGAGLPGKSAVDFADIFFEFDRYDLSDEARQILRRHADWLLKNKAYFVVVEGHCDERGTTEYNLALGQKRAAEAMKFLLDLGVEAGRIKIISYGEEMPLDPGRTEEAWGKNRRDHFVVTPAK